MKASLLKKLPKDADSLKKWLVTVGVSGVILLSLTVYFFVGLFNSYTLFVLPFCLVVLLYLSNRAIVAKENGNIALDIREAFRFSKHFSLKHLWALALLGLLVGFSQGSWGMGNLKDMIVIGGCIMIILAAPSKAKAYELSMKMIVGFALFYAISIWIQMLMPSVYRLYLSALQNGSDVSINKLQSYFTGFTTSPGHTAAYIIAGIFVLTCFFTMKPKFSIGAIAFLFVSLLFTGMKMPVFAAALGVLVWLFISMPSEMRKKVFIILLAGCGALLLLILLFKNQLEAIPVIHRTFDTIEALFSGQDATNKRAELYKLAIELFSEKPIFGIGWGNFRLEVPGTVTWGKMLDVHNIFLQLLCETGIVGFVCFVVPMGCFFVKTVRVFCKLAKTQPDDLWTRLIGFSFMYQIFFLVFGLSDITLYATGEQILYFISCAILASFLLSHDCFLEKGERKNRECKIKEFLLSRLYTMRKKH